MPLPQVFPESLGSRDRIQPRVPQRIIDAGCPEETVQLDRWINLTSTRIWFERSPWEKQATGRSLIHEGEKCALRR